MMKKCAFTGWRLSANDETYFNEIKLTAITYAKRTDWVLFAHPVCFYDQDVSACLLWKLMGCKIQIKILLLSQQTHQPQT